MKKYVDLADKFGNYLGIDVDSDNVYRFLVLNNNAHLKPVLVQRDMSKVCVGAAQLKEAWIDGSNSFHVLDSGLFLVEEEAAEDFIDNLLDTMRH